MARPHGVIGADSKPACASHPRSPDDVSPFSNLCERLRHVVERSELWTLALNRNQDLPGEEMLVLNRHCERGPDQTSQEWAFLHPLAKRVTSALGDLFAPDLYNLAFLMNFDAHVHLHVGPRYAYPIEWRGETFREEHYGSLFGNEHRPASEAELDALAEALRNRL